MNNSVKHAPKNLRSIATKSIFSDLNTQAEAAKALPVVETRKPSIVAKREAMAIQENSRHLTAKPAAVNEAQNTRISMMNDIVNASVSLKGLGKSAPAEWTSRKSLASLTNAQLWETRGKATRMVASANADEAVKKSLKPKLMAGNGGEKATMEAGKVRGKAKAIKEANIAQSHQEDGTALSICPLCGSATFDVKESKCPVCSESYQKYRAVEAATFDFDSEDQYTTIDLDGEEQVLIDGEGNTSVVLPNELEGKLIEHTHELILEESEEPIFIDSGLAAENAAELPDGEEMPVDDEAEATQVAFIKLPIGVEECLDLLQDGNEDSIEVVPTDNGYNIIVALEGSEAPEGEDEFVEDEEVEVVAENDESELPEDDMADFAAEEPIEEDEQETIIIALEELAEGTAIHADGVSSIEELISLIGELLPDTAKITEVDAQPDKDEVIKEDVQEMDAEDDAMLEQPEGDGSVIEGAKPKLPKVTKAKKPAGKKVAAPKKTHRVFESGTIIATRNGQPITLKVRAVYEAALPKLTKAKKDGKKVVAAGKPSATSLASTLENAKTKREFIKGGMETLGSALNTRKLLLSLWDAIKENKPGSAASLLNTLEAMIKTDEPKKADKKKVEATKEPEVKTLKPETKKIKKLDKVVKLSPTTK